MEPTFTKTNRSIVMMRCLWLGCNVFFVTGGNVIFQTLDLAVAGRFWRHPRVGRIGRIDRDGENDMDDAGAGNPMSRKARDMGHPRRSFAYGNVKIENDSITWEMIDRAAERLSKENERAE
jgi:hypothetical protein